ncbi:hypothetical protein PR001_g30314 [Phytophthora rubi]|uniref:Uncharacterized protein n=2 Tax=Phytophthora rubi TaxID=129364 RepID=A0A6A3GUC5_9STRA|nr:hypothetical protein PR002_g30160 [Phytophthora rubi]KAE8960658.1 hypothetical protein PR001_g30314 [Phytophthora rubi]
MVCTMPLIANDQRAMMARTTEITTISGQEYEDTGSSDKTRQTTKQAVKTGLFEIVVHCGSCVAEAQASVTLDVEIRKTIANDTLQPF